VRREYLVRFMKSLLRNCFWISCLLLFSCKSGEQAVPDPAKPAAQDPVPMRIYWVTASGGLRIRSQPSAESAVVGLLDQGAEIEVADSEKHEATVNGRKGYWRKYGEGWIFDGYLEEGWRIYRSAPGRGIPIYSSAAIGSPLRVLRPDTLIRSSSTSRQVFSSAPGWIHGSFSDRMCDYSGTEGWISLADLRPSVPRQPFCSDSVKRNCIDPALKPFILGGSIDDRENCVYQSSIGLMPEGDVLSCSGKIGAWTLQADGSIAVAFHTRTYRVTMAPGDAEGIMITRPPLVIIRKVNLNSLRFPAEVPHRWPEFRENIRRALFSTEKKVDGCP
jgi:hypothetical protein